MLQGIVSGQGIYFIIGETCSQTTLALNFAQSGSQNIIAIAGGLEYGTTPANYTIPALSTLNKVYMYRSTGGATVTLPLPDKNGYYVTIRNDNASGSLNVFSSAGPQIWDTGASLPTTTFVLQNRHAVTFYSQLGTGWLQTSFT